MPLIHLTKTQSVMREETPRMAPLYYTYYTYTFFLIMYIVISLTLLSMNCIKFHIVECRIKEDRSDAIE